MKSFLMKDAEMRVKRAGERLGREEKAKVE
jgi:hypothetical protein